ncbi:MULTISPECIES: glutamate--cysteine ligase [Chromobacterium]|uniref:Glutamate--cysteine ligase n=2 Tax=Chromobacterium TaxID=535 RepID=A0ABS3GM97_9NEIS|nr:MULTISPECIES: glutamate--cysteine ligase [Chromobacterium]AXT44957.1 glutamate--cysteine ligase [Chromobacterium rhizoryzae]MBK0414791.1 glutamate--cysteine ligase [Chromobacterium haemolyticum]MBO0416170.1 glutamate--cysteine ligase [Chromobacterium haemolyticum]MBO0499331.1 glutamate--cysteine ligase [Chromobacterium haemolyticum]MDH0342605.1 glutamate--cysteine ligase [Chromobacterium haemolyticum]
MPPVPHLATALTGPLYELESRILTAQPQIEHWFRSQWHNHAAPFYGSVDLRNSGFKLAPVDMNLFPGGHNNLNRDFLPLAVHAAQSAVEKVCPEARSVLLIPENHTRNTFYLQNIAALVHIFEQAGLKVRLGSLNPEITEPTELQSANGDTVRLEPIERRGNRLVLADGFNPCVVLLNNDLSGGIPDLLKGLEQNLLPPLHAGWAVRRKSNHFAAYDKVCEDFARLISIDPWTINPYFASCSGLDFHARTGEEQLADEVSRMLDKIRVKYREYGIDNDPFVIVKADAGTYGMGVMSVKSPDEVLGLNRKARNKMSVVKEGLEVSEVIVQEGVYTFETVEDAVAEPVVYMMDRYVTGGFYRVHTGRGIDENLNAPGMHFVPLSFETACLPDKQGTPDCAPNRFYSYGVISRLALLAASLELEATDPDAEE